MHQLQPDGHLQSNSVMWVVDLGTEGNLTLSSVQPHELGKNHKFSGFGQIISNIYSNSNSLALLSVGKTSAIDSTNPKVRGQVSDMLGLSKVPICMQFWMEWRDSCDGDTRSKYGWAAREPMTLVNMLHNHFKCQCHAFSVCLSYCFFFLSLFVLTAGPSNTLPGCEGRLPW